MASCGPWCFPVKGVGVPLMGMKSLSWSVRKMPTQIFPCIFLRKSGSIFLHFGLAFGSVLTDATNIDHVCEFGFSIHFSPGSTSQTSIFYAETGNARRDARYP